jgi:putative ABC transport system permease protein
MTLLQFTFKNLSRRPIRTALTVMGIGVGIGAVVALLGLARGLTQSWEDAINARGTDLVVRKGHGLMAQPFDDKLIDQVRADSRVAEATGVLVETLSVEEVPIMVVSGREWGGYLWDSLKVVQGRLPKDANEKAVVVGTLAIASLEKKVGDTVSLEGGDFTICGIVDGKAFVENGSLFIALNQLQELMQKQGRMNFINLKAKEGTRIEDLQQALAKKLEGYSVDTAREVAQNNDGVKIFEAMNWGTSAVALLVGTFGVMNTMFMSVFERTREIGILIAIGWRRGRILRMIVYESVVLCLFAGLLGIGFGFVLLKVLAALPFIAGKLEPHFGSDIVIIALGLSVFVGLLSGLYPAWHCTKINPSEALRS